MKMNDLAGKAETIDFKLNGETISAFAIPPRATASAG